MPGALPGDGTGPGRAAAPGQGLHQGRGIGRQPKERRMKEKTHDSELVEKKIPKRTRQLPHTPREMGLSGEIWGLHRELKLGLCWPKFFFLL
jgi:hypothetical protein